MKNIMLKKILPLFLTLALVLTMTGMGTLVAKADDVKANGPVKILEVLDNKNTSGTEATIYESNEVKMKVTLKDADTKKVIKEDASFEIYAKADKKFEDILGFVDLEEGKASEELVLDPGEYVLQQADEVDGYKDAKDKEFEVKKDQKDEISLTVNLRSVARTQAEPKETLDPEVPEEPKDPEDPSVKEKLKTTVKAVWIPSDTKEPIDVQLKDVLGAEATLKDGEEEATFEYEEGTTPIFEIVNKASLEENYTIKETGDLTNGYTVTLISSKTHAPINAKVEGLDNEIGNVDLSLKTGEEEVATAKAEATNEWKTVFSAGSVVPIYIYDQETGNAITYSVVAPAVDGYEVPEVTGDTTEGFTVTYKKMPVDPIPETKTVNIKANFEDAEGNTIPGFEVKANIVMEDETKTVTLENKEGVWSAEEVLPADAEYDVIPVNGKDYTGDVYEGDTDTNQWILLYTKNPVASDPDPDPTPVPPTDDTTEEQDDRISVSVKVVWKDTTAAKKKVNVKLLHKSNKKVYKVIDVTSEAKWKNSFKKVDTSGKYILSPEKIDGYTWKASGSITKGFTITYTKNKTTETTTKATTATKTTTTATSTTATATTAKNAKTGDDNQLVMYVIILCVAAAGFVVLRKKNRTR